MKMLLGSIVCFLVLCVSTAGGDTKKVRTLDSFIFTDCKVVIAELGEPRDIKTKDEIVTWDIRDNAVSFNKDGRVVSILTTGRLRTDKNLGVGDAAGDVYKVYGWPTTTESNTATLKATPYLRLKYAKNTFFINEDMKVVAVEACSEK